jgi:hypothetical protein
MSEQSAPKGNGGSPPPPKVVFHYIKNAAFRVIHTDGAFGGITPSGHIHMSLYSERTPIPQRMAHPLNPNGTLGEPIPSETVGKDGIVREVDVDVMMNIETTKSLYMWLGQKIKEHEALDQQIKKAQSQGGNK